MIIGEDITLVCDEKAASTHGLIAGGAEERRLSGDRADDCHNGGADLLYGFCDGGLDIRIDKSQRLTRICIASRKNLLDGT
jgi:hypothetical protein